MRSRCHCSAPVSNQAEGRDDAKMPHTAMNIAAITGPITSDRHDHDYHQERRGGQARHAPACHGLTAAAVTLPIAPALTVIVVRHPTRHLCCSSSRSTCRPRPDRTLPPVGGHRHLSPRLCFVAIIRGSCMRSPTRPPVRPAANQRNTCPWSFPSGRDASSVASKLRRSL
jgi:hypothetical protein